MWGLLAPTPLGRVADPAPREKCCAFFRYFKWLTRKGVDVPGLMPDGNAGKRPPPSAKVTGIPPRSGVASATANPSTLTRIFRRIKDRVFAMGHVTRILWFAPRRYVRCGQSHAVVCGVGGRRQNKCGGEYKRGQPPACGRAGNSTNVCLRIVLPPAVVSRVSVWQASVRGLQPPHSVQVRSSPFKSVRGAYSRDGGLHSRQRATPCARSRARQTQNANVTTEPGSSRTRAKRFRYFNCAHETRSPALVKTATSPPSGFLPTTA